MIDIQNIRPTGILHVGGNVGQEAALYNSMGAKRVVWIEANPYLIDELMKNVEQYDHEVYSFAAGENEGTVVLHITNNDGLSSSVLDLGTHSLHHPTVHYIEDIKVPMRRVDSIDLTDLDFLVIDVQGFELMVLRGFQNLSQFKWILLEVNKEELYKGCALIDEIDEYLKDYKRVETVWTENNWGESLFVKL